MIKTRTLIASIVAALSTLGGHEASAQQKFSTIAAEKCGHVVVGSGDNADAAERNARYRCRIRGGWDCNHLIEPTTVPAPNGDRCAAVAMHRVGLCHFVVKVGLGKSEEEARTMAVQLCSGASGAAQCKVPPSHSICR